MTKLSKTEQELETKMLEILNKLLQPHKKIGLILALIKEALPKLAKAEIAEAKKAGIKEVAEWIRNNAPEGYDQLDNEKPLYLLYIDKEQWQAKLKELGYDRTK